MSEGREEYRTRKRDHLKIVQQDSQQDSQPGADDAGKDAVGGDVGAVSGGALANAIMYACTGWVALCMERTCASVDVQPIAARLYEAAVTLEPKAEGEGWECQPDTVLLRVRLEVEVGLIVRTVVEPVRP
ncbi:MAG: hypothetical protein OJF49_003216 [Ktedonobacterales bacterium]|jgi:hypothetical protein|nr:MAG: hypothetical protein OJF49_003216 [Ktedonobacterales bacterium]